MTRSRLARTRGSDPYNPDNQPPKHRNFGRSSKYTEHYREVVGEMAAAGATNEEIAKALGIHVSTLYEWANTRPDFSEALRPNKEIATNRVENALYTTAMDGNVTAQIFFLKNRRPNEWRDKRDVEVGGELKLEDSDDRKLALAALDLLLGRLDDDEPFTIEGIANEE